MTKNIKIDTNVSFFLLPTNQFDKPLPLQQSYSRTVEPQSTPKIFEILIQSVL